MSTHMILQIIFNPNTREKLASHHHGILINHEGIEMNEHQMRFPDYLMCIQLVSSTITLLSFYLWYVSRKTQ